MNSMVLEVFTQPELLTHFYKAGTKNWPKNFTSPYIQALCHVILEVSPFNE